MYWYKTLYLVLVYLLANPLNPQSDASRFQGQSTESKPNVVARINTAGSPQSLVAVFAPDNNIPLRKQAIQASLNVLFSPDNLWVATYGRVAGVVGSQLTYAHTGQPPNRLSVADDEAPLFIRFSQDSNYLAYTLVSYTELRWQLNIVRLIDETTARYVGKFDYSTSTAESTKASGGTNSETKRREFAGVPEVLAWGTDSVIIGEVQLETNSINRYSGIYRVALESTDSKETPLPESVLISGEPMLGSPIISPDGWHLAFLQVAHDDLRLHQLKVIDTVNGKTTAEFSIKPTKMASTAVWLPDSQFFLIITGTSATVTNLNTTTQSSPIVLDAEKEHYLYSLRVCGNTLFFVTQLYKTDFSGESTLYSAPLGNLSDRSKPLATGQIINLIGCAA